MTAQFTRPLLILGIALLFNFGLVPNANAAGAAKPSLQQALANLKIPPDWYDSVQVDYDLNKPWKDARLEVRRLLGEHKQREAIKLTCLYREKGDIGNGHEYPMYLFMGGEIAWAIPAYHEFIEKEPKSDVHSRITLAACYCHFGEYEKALEQLNLALRFLPEPPWTIAREADVNDRIGDVYVEMGQPDMARPHYEKAAKLYPTSNQPYGKHQLHLRAQKVRSKLDLIAMESLKPGSLRDGTYSAYTIAYVDTMTVTVVVKGGRIADIKLRHKEKIDLNATTIIPQRIIEEQSLQVDGITGATVTYQAIRDGALQALKKAGL